MGKEDLWDDSALINAFNDAISTYKVMHSRASNVSSKEKNLEALEDEMNEFKRKEETDDRRKGERDDNGKGASINTTEMGETVNHSPVKEDSPVEIVDTEKLAGTKNEQNTHDKPVEDISSHSVDDYNRLLNKYYELEEQRQQVLQQLQQFGNWNHQSSGSTSQEHQAYASQASYPTETSFYCPYGCQSWVSPCITSPCCLGGNMVDKTCNATLECGQDANSASLQNPDLNKIAMGSAERALSSVRQATKTNAFPKEGKESEMRTGCLETNSETDLTEVFNAWYSAGFYTGKYLSKQSYSKK